MREECQWNFDTFFKTGIILAIVIQFVALTWNRNSLYITNDCIPHDFFKQLKIIVRAHLAENAFS